MKNIYYFVLLGYCLWGLLALRLTPNPLILAIISSVVGNIGLGTAALHTLYVNRRLMPNELRPPWYLPDLRQHPLRRRLAAHIHVAVVGVAAKAQPTVLPFPIQRIQVEVRQQRRQRPALRRALNEPPPLRRAGRRLCFLLRNLRVRPLSAFGKSVFLSRFSHHVAGRSESKCPPLGMIGSGDGDCAPAPSHTTGVAPHAPWLPPASARRVRFSVSGGWTRRPYPRAARSDGTSNP